MAEQVSTAETSEEIASLLADLTEGDYLQILTTDEQYEAGVEIPTQEDRWKSVLKRIFGAGVEGES
jgi:hypothetical protein